MSGAAWLYDTHLPASKVFLLGQPEKPGRKFISLH